MILEYPIWYTNANAIQLPVHSLSAFIRSLLSLPWLCGSLFVCSQFHALTSWAKRFRISHYPFHLFILPKFWWLNMIFLFFFGRSLTVLLELAVGAGKIPSINMHGNGWKKHSHNAGSVQLRKGFSLCWLRHRAHAISNNNAMPQQELYCKSRCI